MVLGLLISYTIAGNELCVSEKAYKVHALYCRFDVAFAIYAHKHP